MVKMRSADILSLDTSEQKKVAKQTKKLKKQIQDGTVSIKEERKIQKVTAEQKRGLLFISHLPHGFYETELKNYFQQFGNVTNVKVCRSRKTGNSKGFAYVEFSHPEVAKIAAETMNNYLMFKKRITAEYIPYEKRPKGLFLGKSSTPTRYSSKVRREKQYQANLQIDESRQLKRSSSRISKLNKKLKRLQNLGINTTFKPLDVTLIKEEKPSLEDFNATHMYLADPLDSEVEIKIPLKKSRKSVRSTSEKLNSLAARSSKSTSLDKSVDSIRTLLTASDNQTINEETSAPPKRVDASTSSPVIKKPKKTRVQKAKGIAKKTKKPMVLNPDTVRKIARELIRKRGDSLLNYPVSSMKKADKKKSSNM